MKRMIVVLLLLVAAAVLVPTGSAAPPSLTSTWHRLNPQGVFPTNAPEHERLQCNEGFTWTCLYDKVPEPALNFNWSDQQGTFTGSATPRGLWTCPAWFPSSVCSTVNRVARGIFAIGPPAVNLNVLEDLIVTKVGKQQRMWAYWREPFSFVCPWFSNFDQALAANPFPLPFNGVDWPANDCVSAP